MTASPLLGLPGAVAGSGDDEAVAWHYGDPMGEQRAAGRHPLLVDLSHHDVLMVTGPDRLTWLHTLTTQHLTDLPDGSRTDGLVLDPQGRVEHAFTITEVGGTVYLVTDPGHGEALLKYLTMMVFWSKVEVAPADLARLRLIGARTDGTLTTADLLDRAPTPGQAMEQSGILISADPAGIDLLVPRAEFAAVAGKLLAAGARPAGTWAHEALRIAAGTPRLGIDTDEKTIPNELPWLDTAVHLHKGCYRGQETVARVHNLGRPPRRLVRLHLDGSVDRLPEIGSALLTADGRVVGRVGSSAHHHENGPMALALLKRSVPLGAPLLADGVDAVADPDDMADPDTAPPVSAIDRRAFSQVRRP
ncbi:CAF17-like 4Fe-4S cluster assembly/insertion protein YgfZ [Nakamurella alba]|uniref:CAF17-like 4Fe-4S cluster assembly/insertion protein YgfZ n=1 Tax=Nakamurella alba TaxID=2665158 RepID=UPI002AC3203E|nr:folate-binding protein [Nakamurella alba]